jgi:hypothetical protein
MRNLGGGGAGYLKQRSATGVHAPAADLFGQTMASVVTLDCTMWILRDVFDFCLPFQAFCGVQAQRSSSFGQTMAAVAWWDLQIMREALLLTVSK